MEEERIVVPVAVKLSQQRQYLTLQKLIAHTAINFYTGWYTILIVQESPSTSKISSIHDGFIS